MSQVQQITLTELKEWLKKETASIIEPMKNKGTNLLQETQERLKDAIESNRKILENSHREMKKNIPKTYRFSRNANKFAENLTKMMEAIKIPEQVSYDSLQTFCNDLNRLITVTEQLRREAYPYITPYFIFDRRRLDATLKRLQDINNELGDFLTTKYSKAKTAEGASGMVDKLVDTLNHMSETKTEREKVQQIEKFLQAKLQETQQKIAQVQTRAELTELLAAEERIEELRENVKYNLRYLQKPFFKLQSLAKSGDVAIPVDEVKKLGDYLDDPFEALATEEEGYQTLRGILKKLNDAINQKKLKLKSTRLRKAQEQIDGVLNKELFNTLHKNCREARSQENKMLTSSAIVALQNELTQLQNQLKELQKENEFTISRGKALENEHKKLIEKIEIQKKELEKTAFQLTNKNIQVVLTQTK
jgi:uncharacterized protein YunC (DUF1805 family)